MTREAFFADVLRGAGDAQQDQFSTGQVRAVVELAGRRSAPLADADHLGVLAELVVHAGIKEIERTLPQTLVAESLAVANDAAVDLVHLVEAPAPHHRRQDLATDAAGA